MEPISHVLTQYCIKKRKMHLLLLEKENDIHNLCTEIFTSPHTTSHPVIHPT